MSYGYWVRRAKYPYEQTSPAVNDKDTHVCRLPGDKIKDLNVTDLWRCQDCWTLWEFQGTWQRAGWRTRWKYRNVPLRPTAIIGSADGRRPPSEGAWSEEARRESAEELMKALEELRRKRGPSDYGL